MTGKFLAILLLLSALVGGVAMYYLQVYAYYEEVVPTGTDDVMLTALDGTRAPIPFANFQGIDAESSPIRYRVCFDTTLTLDEATARYEPYDNAAPRVAPGWFDCFDAEAIAAEMDAGTAKVFVDQRNREFGIDRVVAITEDGRGYVWHEINECGDKAYDGSPLGDECPPRDGVN
ncbi:DUF6446 family protein [Aestuariicoccus sp. MJ-SS9]|uniref:DUF6446 family protein n=1 Tax=Aestuariicoccus sp. MJ-SS9 TaxID=3079855 RepID=UPI0029092648|nr:DUF6446 family protein [Aestuariicoccus sp. MJ-SS9]MDU8911942.1 DUF6446 family protein [Aestuariicoccus sp. MJ-SS9]